METAGLIITVVVQEFLITSFAPQPKGQLFLLINLTGEESKCFISKFIELILFFSSTADDTFLTHFLQWLDLYVFYGIKLTRVIF